MILEPVERGHRPVFERPLDPVHDPLEAVDAPLDPAPAGRDQLDDEREILDARLALGREVALEPFEAANRLTREPTHLRDVPGNWEDLGAHALLHGLGESFRDPRLELGGGLGKGLESAFCLLERSFEIGRSNLSLARSGEAPTGPFEGVAIHEADCSVSIGCAPLNSTTSSRPS